MKQQTPLLLTLSLILFLVAACSPKAATPSAQSQIQQAVAATIAAIPSPTRVAPPTAYPSPTPFSLAGLFCEYQFCIGHPIDISFFDVSAQRNPAAPSSYSQGFLAGLNGTLFIQVIWQIAPGIGDPNFMLDTLLDDAVDAPTGSNEVFLLRDMNVVYTDITVTASPALPYGGAGAWVCKDRVFAWKVYTPQADGARGLFDEAMNRFTCGQ